ncbi:hypothetical protein dqs_1936 [Azoarcus olearius]|uniref:DUF2334 domain-containing protein n=1 Tax=Azoarcus sp. (strain BH72) TaxID=418699 RepID=UPI0008063DFE|nr:polysaccharide deacetylase family protein [Azoarcus olearius]ANQ84974.1 hypothetical protein dqs_1936 [Azoarcus olearius]
MKPRPSLERPAALCVAIHDVAPATWARCERLLAVVEEVAPLPLTLLVVPDYHRRGDGTPGWYLEALEARRARGDELALHGWVHLDESGRCHGPREWWRRRVMTASEGEFSALTARAARFRLGVGQTWFRNHGWPLYGFVAPAWLLSPGSWETLDDSPLRYTTTADAFYLLHPRRRHASPCFAWSTRSPWREALSLRWNGRPARLAARGPMRLALHPDDALHPRVLNQIQYLVDALLRDHEPMTKARLAMRLGGEPLGGLSAPPPARGDPITLVAPPYTAGATTASDNRATPPPMATPASTSLG